MYTSLIAAVVNIILNFLLIPDFGAYGAAIATASAYAACFVIRIVDVRTHIPFKVSYFKIIVNTIVICYMAFVASKEPKFMWLQLIVLFIAVTVFNFESVISTLRKILNRVAPKNENTAEGTN